MGRTIPSPASIVTASTSARSRAAVATTWMPVRASPNVIARPRPRPAPVTIATRPLIESGAIQRRPPVQPRSECRETDEHARLDAAVGDALVVEDRQRSRGGVAITLDVVRHFFGRKRELI